LDGTFIYATAGVVKKHSRDLDGVLAEVAGIVRNKDLVTGPQFFEGSKPPTSSGIGVVTQAYGEGGGPPAFAQVLILEMVKVVCFDTVL
jgi:hypothetical protein